PVSEGCVECASNADTGSINRDFLVVPALGEDRRTRGIDRGGVVILVELHPFPAQPPVKPGNPPDGHSEHGVVMPDRRHSYSSSSVVSVPGVALVVAPADHVVPKCINPRAWIEPAFTEIPHPGNRGKKGVSCLDRPALDHCSPVRTGYLRDGARAKLNPVNAIPPLHPGVDGPRVA